MKTQRRKQDKEREHRPKRFYIIVNEQGGAQRDNAMRSIYAFCGSFLKLREASSSRRGTFLRRGVY